MKCCSKSCNASFQSVSRSRIVYLSFLPAVPSKPSSISASTSCSLQNSVLELMQIRPSLADMLRKRLFLPFLTAFYSVNRTWLAPLFWNIDLLLQAQLSPGISLSDTSSGSNCHMDVLLFHKAVLWALKIPFEAFWPLRLLRCFLESFIARDYDFFPDRRSSLLFI